MTLRSKFCWRVRPEFLMHSTMPCLISISIIKNKWLMRGRRTYPAEGGSRACGSGSGQRYLGMSWMEDHGMLASSWCIEDAIF